MKVIFNRGFAAGRDENGQLITYVIGQVADIDEDKALRFIGRGWAQPYQKPKDVEIQKAVKDEVQENSESGSKSNKPKRRKGSSKSNRKR